MNPLSKHESGARRVLLVEDDPSAREATRRFLEHCGHDVRAAADSASAFEVAQQQPPEVLVCDCNLESKLDGVELARRLQAAHGCAVIFVTAYTEAALEAGARGIPGAGYLRKPVSLSDLAAAVADAADQRTDRS